MGLIGMRFHPRTHSTRRGRSILAVLDRALAGHRKRRRPGCRGIVLGTQSQCNQRKRIDFAAALQLLLALKAFEGVAAILIPHPACLLGFQIALGHERLLNLLIPLRRWSHLPSPPGHCPPLPAALRGGRFGSRCLGMAPICRAGSGGRALAGRGGSGGGPMCCAGCNRSLGGPPSHTMEWSAWATPCRQADSTPGTCVVNSVTIFSERRITALRVTVDRKSTRLNSSHL